MTSIAVASSPSSAQATSASPSASAAVKRLGHAFLVLRFDRGEERQRERALREILRDGAEPLAEAVALAHVRLQVDRRQVARRRDSLALELGDHPLAVGAARERDDVDEPGADVVGVVGERDLEPVDAGEQLAVAGRGGLAHGEDPVELLELADPERGADVVDAVVEAEPRVVEPAAAVGAALVAQADELTPGLLGRAS